MGLLSGIQSAVDRDEQTDTAMSLREGDRLRGPDGREWIVTDAMAKTMGECFTLLEDAQNRSEQRGVTSNADLIENYEIISTVERPERMDLSWRDS